MGLDASVTRPVRRRPQKLVAGLCVVRSLMRRHIRDHYVHPSTSTCDELRTNWIVRSEWFVLMTDDELLPSSELDLEEAVIHDGSALNVSVRDGYLQNPCIWEVVGHTHQLWVFETLREHGDARDRIREPQTGPCGKPTNVSSSTPTIFENPPWREF